jgi:hypothetical protein
VKKFLWPRSALISTLVVVWIPLKPNPTVSWWLLIFVGWPRRTPFSGAEKPPIAFIGELKKQVRRGLILRGEGQSAISDRAGVAHGHLKSQRNITSTGKEIGPWGPPLDAKAGGLRSRAYPAAGTDLKSSGLVRSLLFWPGQKGTSPDPAFQADVEA